MAFRSWRWFLALWLLRLENWSFTSQPEAFVDMHHMWSSQLSEGCQQPVRTETQLGAEVVKGVQQTNSVTLASQAKEEIKALEAALAALPDVEPFGKVRAPLEERRQYARKEARDSNPLDQRLEGCRGALQRASKAKQAAIVQKQAAQAAFEKAEADESRILADLADLEKQALSPTTQPTCLQTISCKADQFSAAVIELSRYMPATEASTIQAALDGLLSLNAQAAEKASRAKAEGLDTPDDVLLDILKPGSEGDAQEMHRAVRRRIRARQCSDVPVGGPMAATESTAG